MAPAKSIDKPTLVGVKTPQVRKACLDRNQKQQNVYYKEYNIHQHEKKDSEEFNRVYGKLQKHILTTVASQKKAILQKIHIAQKWLTDLQASIFLSVEYRQKNLVF